MKNKLKKMLSFALALAMGVSSVVSPVFAEESETEVLSESSAEVQVDGDVTFSANDLETDNYTNAEQTEDAGLDLSLSSDSDSIVIYVDEDGNITETDSGEIIDAEPFESSVSAASENTEISVEDDMLTQSENLSETSEADENTADMLITEEESDTEGYKKININAIADGESNTNFRLYFWKYDGALPLNAEDWEDYFNNPSESIVIDGLDGTKATVDLPMVRANGTEVYTQATFLNEYRNKDQQLQSVYLDFTVEAGAKVDAAIYLTLQDINPNEVYIMAEAACIVENCEDGEDAKVTLDYLNLNWEPYEASVESETEIHELATELIATADDTVILSETEYDAYEIDEFFDTVFEDAYMETELYLEDSNVIYETENEADDIAFSGDKDLNENLEEKFADIDEADNIAESAAEQADEEFDVIDDVDEEFQPAQNDTDNEAAEDESAETDEEGDTEFELENQTDEEFEPELESEGESESEYAFFYDNFNFNIANYELPVNENGYLAADAQISLSADKAGEIDADTLTVQMNVVIPDGIVLPESLKVSANKVKDQNNDTWFEFTKLSGSKNSVQIDDAAVADNVISLLFAVTGSDDLFAGWQIAMYGTAMKIENFESVEDTEIDMIELSVSAELTASEYGSIILTADNRIFVGTIDESAYDVQELMINDGDYDWILVPLDDYLSVDYQYNGTLISFHTKYLDEVSTALQDMYVEPDNVLESSYGFYTFPTERDEDYYMKFKDIFVGTDTQGNPYTYNATIYFWSVPASTSTRCGALRVIKNAASSSILMTRSPETIEQTLSGITLPGHFIIDSEWHFYDPNVGDGFTEEVYPSGFVKTTDNDIHEGQGRTESIDYAILHEDNLITIEESNYDTQYYLVGTDESSKAKGSEIFLCFSTSSSQPLHLSYSGYNNLNSSYESACYDINFNIVGETPADAAIPTTKYVANFVDTTGYCDVLAPQDEVDGYTFNGWYTDPELTEKWTGSTSTQDDVELYASYIPVQLYGDLTVTKKIEGVDSTDNEFTFVLSGTSSDGDDIELTHTFSGIDDSESYTFENVPVGSDYTLTEIYDSDTWTSDTPSQPIEIKANEATGEPYLTEVAVTNTARTGNLTIVKMLDTCGYDITDFDQFDFTLSGTAANGSELNETFYLAADDFHNGQASITFKDLYVGTYYLTEIMDMENDFWTTTVDNMSAPVYPDSDNSVIVYNYLKRGSITVYKTLNTESFDFPDLGDMTIYFSLNGTADIGDVIHDQISLTALDFVDNQASAIFNNVPYGNYSVSETFYTDDYGWKVSGESSQPVTIGTLEETKEVSFENTLRTGNLKVVKYLKIDSQYEIKDFDDVEFIFTLSGRSRAGVQVNDTVSINLSDFAGLDYAEAVFTDVPIGHYSVTETITGSAAPAWSVSDNPVQYNIEVSDVYDNSVYFTNVMNYGSVCVNKTVNIGQASANEYEDSENFTFVLSGTATAGFPYTVSNTMTASDFTGTTGTLTFNDVPVGSYTITEELQGAAADMWVIDGDAVQNVPVSANETTDVYYKNTLASGTLTVTKELDFGNYDVSDVDDFSFTFSLKEEENDSADERTFTFDSEDFTDGTASVTFENVMYGTYIITEIMDDSDTAVWTPVNGKEQAVTVGGSHPDAEVTFKNKLNTGNLAMTKIIDGVDSTNNEFTFSLSGTSAAGIEVNLTHTFSGIDGAETYTFNDIPVGNDYTLTETVYDSNTWKSDAVFQNVKITANSETGKANTTDVTVTNTARKGNLEVVKVLETGKYTSSQLSNYGPFEFTLTGTSNAGVEIDRTKYAAASDFHNGSASIIFENVPSGTYTVTETSTESNGLWTAESTSEEAIVYPDLTNQIKFVNDLNCGTVTVNKTISYNDIDFAALKDVDLRFTLAGTSDTGIDVEEYLDISASDFVINKASAVFTGIPYGSYHVTETMNDDTAIAWKVTGNSSIPVDVCNNNNSANAAVEFTNTLKTGNLNVVKYLDIDAKYDTKEMDNVKFAFTLYGISYAGVQVNETVYIDASDFDGNNFAEVMFTNIPAGNYNIKETTEGSAAPAWAVSGNAEQNDVIVSEDYDNTVYFTNVMNYGSVRVKKTVETGDASEYELKNVENFTFVLSGTAAAGFGFTQTEYMNAADFTGNTGILLFENVPVGSYTVTENFGDACSEMWSVDGDKTQSVAVAANSVTDAVYTNILGSGTVTVTKELTNIDNYDTSSLSNCFFTFTLKGIDSSSSVTRSITLDADSFINGKASAAFSDIPYGNYVVTETMEDMVEAGWTPVNGREQTTSVTADDPDAEVTFKNELNTGSLTVVKYLDADNYDLSSLDNAAFTFILTGKSYAGIVINQSLTISASDFSGGNTVSAVFTDIPAGSYIITEEINESSVPTWSVSGNAVQDATVSASSNNTVYFTNVLNYGSVYVNKIIDIGNADLSDIDNFGVFTFTLSGTSTAGISITQSRDISVGDFNGDLAQVSFENVPVGSYNVTESVSEGSADMWTASDSVTQEVDVASHEESTVTFMNKLGSGSVTVTKVLDIPSEYDIASLKECSFTFTLVGAGNGSSIVRSVTFGPDDLKSGTASVEFDDIPYGTYIVTETMEDTVDVCWTPLEGRVQTVNVSPSDPDGKAEFKNRLNTGDLTVVKYLDEGDYDISSLEDVTFTFTLSGESYAGISIDRFVEISASDFGNGDTAYARFTDIPAGSYVIKETSEGQAAPAWSVSGNAVQEVTAASDDNTTVYFTNVLNYGSVQVYKDIDIGNASLTDIENSGVFTFTLSGHSAAGIDISQSKFVSLDDFSGARASVMFDNIPIGSYTITEEIEDPANMWSVSGDPKQDVTVGTGETATIEFKNIMSTGSITVTKYLDGGSYDISDLTQYSFTFTISSADSGSSILKSVTFTPDKFTNGQASETFTDIPYGTYFVTETMDSSVSDDWTASDGTQKVVTLSAESTNGNENAEFTNTLNTGNLTVVKTLEAGDYDISAIKDVSFVFTLTGTSNAGVDINTQLSIKASDLAGDGTASVTFKDIPSGTYIVTESSEGKAASSWSVSENASQEVIIAANTTSTAWFTNSLNIGTVTVIKKIDVGKFSMADIDTDDYFTFVLTGTSASGIPVSKTEHIYMSDFASKTASVTFDNIPIGSYTVQESKGSFSEELWSADGADTLDIEVVKGENAEVAFTNKLNLGSVTVNKTLNMKDYTADSLEYTYFTFLLEGTANSGVSVSKEMMLSAKDFVNNEASVTFEDVPYGEYNIYETMAAEVAAEWSCTNGAEQHVTVSSQKENTESVFENKLNTGDLTVVKTLESRDYDLSDLNNASFTFTLYGTSDVGVTIEQELSVNASDFAGGTTATVVFSDVPVGSYIITEEVSSSSAPAWSVSGNAVQDVEISANRMSTSYFTNTLNLGEVTVIKNVDTGDFSSDDIENYEYFTFVLDGTASSGINITKTAHVSASDFSNGTASVTFTDVPVGVYHVTENMSDLSGELWSIASDNIVSIDVAKGDNAEVTFTNKLNLGSVTVYKTLETGDYNADNLEYTYFTFVLDGTANSGIHVYETKMISAKDFINKNADVTFDDIPYGTYDVYEVVTDKAAAEWTCTDGAEKQVTVSSSKTNADVSFTNKLNTGSLTVVKDLDAGDYDISSLEDVTFVFTLTGTSDVGIYVEKEVSVSASDLAGSGTAYVTFEDVPLGTYIVTESSEGSAAPAWSVSGSTIQEAAIAANTTSTVWFTNSLNVGDVTVVKNVDAGTYDMSDIDGGDYFTFVLSGTSKSGIPVSKTAHIYMSDFESKTASVTFENIPIGTYTVTEDTSTMNDELWSIAGDKSVNVDVEKGKNAEAKFTNKLNLGSVKVTKLLDMDNYTAEDLQYTYFTFVLEGTSNSGVKVSEELMISANDFVNDEASVTFDDIPYGTYNIYENMTGEVAAEWTCKSGAETQVTVSNNNKNAEVSFTNDLNTGNLTVVKTLEAGDYDLSEMNDVAFTFTLSGVSDVGVEIEVPMTISASDFAGGNTASVTFKDIPVGTYIIKEETSGQAAPSWSVSENAVQDIEVAANRTSTAYFTNELNLGEVTVIKNIDAGGFVSDNIKDYEYFTFVLNGTAASGIKISKTAHVSVSDFSHGTASVTFTDVPVGNYTVSENMNELTADLWEVVGEDSVSVDVSKGETAEAEFTNKLTLHTVTVHKTVNDPSGTISLPEGFEFTLTGRSDTGIEISEKSRTDKNGDAIFNAVPIGTYYVAEVGTPDISSGIAEWWAIDGGSMEVKLTEDTAITMSNTYKTGNLTIDKLLDGGENVKSNTFVFTLSGISDSGVEINQTGSIIGAGSYTFENIPIGTYTLTEDCDSDTWIAGMDSKEVVIGYNSDAHISVTNKLITRTQVSIMDFDTETELDGAVYTVYDKDGNAIEKTESRHGANLVLYNLNIGDTYTVEINTPAEGYSNMVYVKDSYELSSWYDMSLDSVSKNKVTFTLVDTDETQIVSIFLQPVMANVIVSKSGEVPSVAIDENGTIGEIVYTVSGLPNAEYDIVAADDIANPDGYSEDVYAKGEVIEHLVTDDTGEAESSPLYMGVYDIVETKAPEGYTRYDNDHTVTVDLSSYYYSNYYMSGNYSAAFEVTEKFYNDRQMLDIGENPAFPVHADPNDPTSTMSDTPTQNKNGDPNNYLQGKAGIYAVGIDGDESVYLEGTEFTLYAYSDIADVYGNVIIPAGTEIEKAVTAENGLATFSTDLPIGMYVARETNASYGYYSSNAEVFFDLTVYEDDDEVQIVRQNGTIENVITKTHLTLLDNLTDNELAGATIVITDSNGNTFDTIVTENTNGEGYTILGLDPDETYTITEIIPRDGYTWDLIDKDGALIDSGNAVHLMIPDVVIDSDLSNIPKEAVLNLYNNYVTGHMNLSKNGEVLTDAEADIVRQGDMPYFDYDDKQLKGVEFTVYAADDIYHPDGITGLLYSAGDIVDVDVRNAAVPAVELTDENGLVCFEGMYLGEYIVAETSVPYGYTVNNIETPFTLAYKDYITFDVEAVGGLIEYTNTRQKVNIEITKYDAEKTDLTLAGAVFGLYNDSDIMSDSGALLIPADTLIEMETTGEDGTARFLSDIPLGMYYVMEIAAPDGYTSSYERMNIDAAYRYDGRDVINIAGDVYDEITKVEIYKMDADSDAAIEGASFEVLDAWGEVVDSWTSNEDAHLIEGLVVGRTYTLVETDPAVGYATADPVEFTVLDREETDSNDSERLIGEANDTEIQSNETEFGLESENESEEDDSEDNTGEVAEDGESEKDSEDDIAAYANATLASLIETDAVHTQAPYDDSSADSGYASQRVEMRDTPITVSISAIDITTVEPLEGVRVNIYDANNRLAYEKVDLNWKQAYVPAGTYTIETTVVPDGYVRPDPVAITVTDTEELQQFVVPVDYTKGRVAVYDQDTEESVYDTLANVYDADGELLFEAVTLDWIREYLPIGDYTIEVTRVPSGYVTPDPVDIEIEELAEWQDFDISLDHIKTLVRTFDANTGDIMDDKVRADIYDTDGYLIYENVDIAWAKEYLPIGEYIVEIVEVPEGYVLPETTGITVLDTGEWQVFDIDVDHIKVQVQAIDANTGENVKGSTADVYDENGIMLYEGVGLDWVEEYLPAGNYTVQSATVPDGYAVPDDYNMEVEAAGEWQNFEIPLGYINIEISKLDADTDEFIPDAYLELTDANGMVYDSWTTTDEAHVIEKISAGRYTLTEVKTPKGYEIANPMTIVVTATTETQTFIMRDEPAEIDETETEKIVESEETPIIMIATASSDGNDEDGSVSATTTSNSSYSRDNNESSCGNSNDSNSGNSNGSTTSTQSSQSGGTSFQTFQSNGSSTPSTQSTSTSSSSSSNESGSSSSASSQSNPDDYLKGDYQVQTGDNFNGFEIAVGISMIAALLVLGFWYTREKEN